MSHNPTLDLRVRAILAVALAGCATAPADGDDAAETVVQGATTTLTFAAAADAEVAQATPTAALGGAAKLGSDGDPVRQALLRFTVSGVVGSVTSAKLRCFATNGSTQGPSLFATTGAWTEAAVTWNTRPAATGAALATLGAVTPSTWIELDATSAVRGNGTFDFALIPTSTDSIECNAREAATNRPELVLTVAAPAIACPAAFPREAFRDDFDGSAVDTTRWDVIQQNSGGGGTFTQLTKMLASNVSVAGGRLHIASRRHCQDPYPAGAADSPAKCSASNFYSGGWVKTKNAYAPGRGLMVFLAKMPPPVPGIFPALWARNTRGDTLYGEFDLIETWWDLRSKGVASNPDQFAVTTWMSTNAQFHTPGAVVGPFTNLTTGLHVWEVEWDAEAATPVARYYYRDAPGATRVLLSTVTATSNGLAGKITAQQFQDALRQGWRAYADFAVQPDTVWHVGPDTAASYDPEDVEIDSVVICQP
jgi:hypothetical protein